MSSSGNIINYNVRTAKSVERKMIMYSVKELLKHVHFSDCRYIGFGSTYFTDFKLFHRELHIESMLSFEIDETLLRRVEFNKPYKCIEIRIGKSTDLLPFIEWPNNQVNLVWLDYDGEMNYDIFNDIEHVFTNASYRSIYLMTCNKQLKNYSVQTFNEAFWELVPNDIEQSDFSGENDFLLIRKMVKNKIDSVIQGRNYALPDAEKLVFRQLFFFTYRDNAPMVSYGGFLDLQANEFDLTNYNLNIFEFIKTNDERYIIDPPLLTYKEVYLLNSHLPNSLEEFNNEAEISFIPESERNKYKKLYKYLPNYMDVVF